MNCKINSLGFALAWKEATMSSSETMTLWRELVTSKQSTEEIALRMSDLCRRLEYERDEARIEARRYRALYYAGDREPPFAWEGKE